MMWACKLSDVVHAEGQKEVRLTTEADLGMAPRCRPKTVYLRDNKPYLAQRAARRSPDLISETKARVESLTAAKISLSFGTT